MEDEIFNSERDEWLLQKGILLLRSANTEGESTSTNKYTYFLCLCHLNFKVNRAVRRGSKLSSYMDLDEDSVQELEDYRTYIIKLCRELESRIDQEGKVSIIVQKYQIEMSLNTSLAIPFYSVQRHIYSLNDDKKHKALALCDCFSSVSLSRDFDEFDLRYLSEE